jgi:hypothetical protein
MSEREPPPVLPVPVQSSASSARAWIVVAVIVLVIGSGLALAATNTPKPPATAQAPATSPVAASRPTSQASPRPSVEPTPWASAELAAFGPNGVPPTVGPGMPVLSPDEAVRRALSAASAEPFLVGGWTQGVVARTCPAASPIPSLAVTSFCHDSYSLGPDLATASTSPVSALLYNADGVTLPALAAIVLRVHADDPRSADCPHGQVASCRSTLVIDGVEWLGQTFLDPTGTPATPHRRRSRAPDSQPRTAPQPP